MEEKMSDQALWFKQAVIYQLHVKGYYDSNADGIGDFLGLRQKLDYLQSLGVTAIWLLPFYPSPLRDDGYDIEDYYDINSNYGSLHEFKLFLQEAHERGLRVITELVINHTSDQHPWFQRARRAKPGSVWRDFYVWSDTSNKYKEARIIFQDFESSNWTWDPVAQAYYWHRFYSHQPDLNFENPLVQKEVFKALDFWFKMGVDGLRLDAIPYLFEQEGTNCENLKTTHEFIKKLRARMDSKFQNRVLIAEANQWPEEAVTYFGNSDECHMAFHFPVMPRLFMAIQMEDRFPIIDILEQTPIPPSNCQWIMFLRNHDELTLEMVSDEERDYMYRIYATDPKARINLGIRRRLAPLLDNDRAKIELMNVLLFSLPGTPVIYYGDEIGMGDNYYLGDRNGVRTPMQWSPDRNAGFSLANPQHLYLPLIIDPAYHYEVVNVENQDHHPSSLLWWTRRLLLVRKRHLAFGSGTLEFIPSTNSKVLAFTRSYEEETILVIANLSRFAQATELDMSQYIGYFPIEIFHYNRFPKIKEKTYHITLCPYGYFWLSLKPSQTVAHLIQEEIMSKIKVSKNWENSLKGNAKHKLEKEVLPVFLKKARWFERKTAMIQNIEIRATVPIGGCRLCFIDVSYTDIQEIDNYLIVLAFASQHEKEQILMDHPSSVIANLQVDDQEGILYGGIYAGSLREALLSFILDRRKLKINGLELVGYKEESLNKNLWGNKDYPLRSHLLKIEQTNTSFVYEDQFFLKLYRKLEEGTNPDIEMKQFLSKKAKFPNVPQYLGTIELKKKDKQHLSIAILERYVPNQGSGWSFTLDSLAGYYENLLALSDSDRFSLLAQSFKKIQSHLESFIGAGYYEAIRILGKRTAEMHVALSTDLEDKAFCPEPFSTLYQRSVYQTLRGSVLSTFRLLKESLHLIPESTIHLVEDVIGKERDILQFYEQLLQMKLSLFRIRIHGDYHLGQVLYQGKDFCVIDFEGEPLQTMSARRVKKSCLRDVAGMLRSFHYAAYKSLFHKSIKAELITELEPWANLWYEYVKDVFLESYMTRIKTSIIPLVCENQEECSYLLQLFLLDKAVYELNYELNARPDWIVIPCKGLLYHLRVMAS